MPLTADRAKPAVPFGGIYRLIDFALSNVVNSGYLQGRRADAVQVAQPRPAHHRRPGGCRRMLGNYVAPVPAQQRVGKHWYLGSADAIYQSPEPDPRRAARHRRRGRRRPRLPDGLLPDGRAARRHRRRGTVAAIRQPIALADQFGVIDVDPDDPRADPRVPREADATRSACRTPPARCSPRWATTSSTPTRWSRRCTRDAERSRAPSTTWAATSCPAFVNQGEAGVYDFKDNDVPGVHRPRPRLLARRRDASTPTSTRTWTWSRRPVFNLYNSEWPIYTDDRAPPPAKFVRGHARPCRRGAQLVGLARLRHLRRPGPRVGARAAGQGAQHDDHRRQRDARRRWRSAATPRSAGRSSKRTCRSTRRRQIGVDHDHDGARGFQVTESGIVGPRDSVVKGTTGAV